MRFTGWKTAAWLLAGLVLASPASAADTLKDAYAAILQGDYDTGRTALDQLLQQDGNDQKARSLSDWLAEYGKTTGERDDLRRKTYEWNVEQAKKAIEEGGKDFLALNFAVQAYSYADDPEAFGDVDWVRDLRTRCMDAAGKLVDEEHWRQAHRYYAALERIYESDKDIRDRRERVARHARLELIYGTTEDVERRIKDVHVQILDRALSLINDNYYQEPDFKKMANGALDSLAVLCTTTKLYDGPKASSLFDGVGNPAAREHFLGRIEELRRDVNADDNFGYRDLKRLFKDIQTSSDESVSLPEGLLVVEFTEGALGELDEFTSMVWPADTQDFDKLMMGEFRGVGIQLGVDEDTRRLKVVTPLENSPALRAGVQPGDLIIRVKDDGLDEDTRDWTTDDAVRKITGTAGTKVTLTMFRPSTGETLPFELTRSEIHLSTIRGVKREVDEDGDRWNYMLDPDAGVAYIHLTGFNPDSHKELRKALEDARAQGMTGLVLDLRNNPGGLLDVAREIVSTFVKSGLVVATRGRREQPQQLEVTGDAEFTKLPLVVLVNDNSASAAEILSGDLQDHDRAVVLGQRTFGKGSVQRVLPLASRLRFNPEPDAAGRLKLTTALYYLPSGRSPHKQSPDATEWGVEPDLKVALTPKESMRVYERELDAYIIHNEGEEKPKVDEDKLAEELAKLSIDANDDGDDSDQEALLTADDIKSLRADPFEAADIDPQLEKALLHLRVKLAADMPWPAKIARKTEVAEP